MPAVKGRVELPSIQVLECQHVRLDEPELLDHTLGRDH